MRKEVVYLVGGIFAGSSFTGMLTYHLLKDDYERRMNIELDKLKKLNEKQVAEAKAKAITDISEDHIIIKKPTKEELEEEEKAITTFQESKKVDYTAYSKPEEPNGDDACDEDILEEEYVSKLYPVEDEDRIPYVIDEDAIESKYDIVTLTFFEGDGTLVDDITGSIVLPEDTISIELLNQFSRSDRDVTYICKESHSTVYEVTKYSGSYSEELGIPDYYGGEKDGDYIDTGGGY